jgi:hypothetical protein
MVYTQEMAIRSGAPYAKVLSVSRGNLECITKLSVCCVGGPCRIALMQYPSLQVGAFHCCSLTGQLDLSTSLLEGLPG